MDFLKYKLEEFAYLNQPLELKDTFIEANAGTGKTYTLKWLVMRLILERGISPNQITMLSFTKKTVAELQQAMRIFFYDAQAFYTGHAHQFNEQEAAYLTKHKTAIESSVFLDYSGYIGTLHSFASKILVEHFYLNQARIDEQSDFNLPLLKEAAAWALQNIASTENYALLPDLKIVIEKIKACNTLQIDWSNITMSSNDLRSEVIKETARNYARLKEQNSIIDYNDLFFLLIKELQRQPHWASTYAAGFKVLIVDEFQDTDRQQIDLLNLIFIKNSAYRIFVGDPKQSIYSFRGSDLNSYLKFKAEVEQSNQFKLTSNYRSTAPLIKAINLIFSISKLPFGTENQIAYNHSLKGSTSHSLLDYPNPPISFCIIESDVPGPSQKGEHPIGEIRNQIFEVILAKIVELKSAGNQGTIAILVSKNATAAKLEVFLKERGQLCFFDGSEQSKPLSSIAIDLLQILQAILNDNLNIGDLRRLLASEFYRISMEAQEQFFASQHNVSALLAEFSRARQVLVVNGFISSIQYLFSKVTELLGLTLYDLRAERRAKADLNAQLVKINNFVERYKSSLAKLSSQAQEQMLSALQTSESSAGGSQIQILTIHNAKGLEFDFVFLPELWEITDKAEKEKIQLNENGLALFLDAESRASKNEQKLDFESRRRIYTAITRAKLACFIYLPLLKFSRLNPENLALAHLLSSSGAGFDDMEQYRQAIIDLSLAQSNLISTELLQLSKINPAKKESTKLQPELAEGAENFADILYSMAGTKIKFRERKLSFSSLTLKGVIHDESDLHDELLSTEDPSNLYSAVVEEQALPGYGVSTGNFFHEMLDLWDFRAIEQSNFYDQLSVQERLLKYSFSADQAQIDFVNKVLKDILALLNPAGAEKLQVVSEWSFVLDLAKTKFNFSIAYSVLMEQLGIERKAEEFKNSLGAKWLEGKIDLILKANSKYFILDWKSNWSKVPLKNPVSQLMQDGQYYLQALVYSLAFYSLGPAHFKQFGGALFVFLRYLEIPTDKDSTNSLLLDEEAIKKMKGVIYIAPECLKTAIEAGLKGG